MIILTFLLSLLSGALYKTDPVQEKLDIVLLFCCLNFVAQIKSMFLHNYCIFHITGYTYTQCSKWVSCRLWHMKNRDVQQLHASSLNSGAIDVRKVACHPPSRCVVACGDYLF